MAEESDIKWIWSGNGLQVNLAEGLFGATAASPAPPKDSFKVVTTQDLWNQYTAQPILLWGKDNKWPYQLRDASKYVGVLKQGLARLVKYAYNQGIFTYKVLEDDSANGRLLVKVVHDKQIEAWFKSSRIHNYLQSAFRNYFEYGITFPAYLLNKERQVAQLRVYDSREVRLERPHPDTGNVENIWLSAKWAEGLTNPIGEFFTQIALLNDYNMLDQLRYGKQFTYAQRIRNFMFNSDEYGGAEWHAVYYNKWLNISGSVPQLKERLFTYAMTINYVVYVDDQYWITVFGKEFTSWPSEKKTTKVKEVQDAIERDLVGVDKGFKTLFAGMRYNADGKEIKSIILEAIDNKLREGTFIPDNLHANGEILAALGVDACLMGATVLGEKISTGSGSNIREAALNLIATLRPERDLILEPLYNVKEINGWDSEIEFGFKDYIIGTQDGRPPVTGNENPNP